MYSGTCRETASLLKEDDLLDWEADFLDWETSFPWWQRASKEIDEPLLGIHPTTEYRRDLYDWCKKGELRFQHCKGCGAWRQVPREMCAECGSWETCSRTTETIFSALG
jgi:hypothetical protein